MTILPSPPGADAYLAVYKQPGIAVHGPGGLLGVLRGRFGAELSLVHRLDKETSGVLLLARDVDALGVCSQYSSIVPIDAQARPLTPMLMWQDQRGTDRCIDIMTRDENAFFTFVERHGIPPVGGGLALGHILYLQEDRPEVHE